VVGCREHRAVGVADRRVEVGHTAGLDDPTEVEVWRRLDRVTRRPPGVAGLGGTVDQRGVHRHEPGEPLGVFGRDGQPERAAPVLADQRDAPEVETLEKRHEPVGEVRHHHPADLAQLGDQPPVEVAPGRLAVQAEYRLVDVGVADVDVGHLRRADRDVLDVVVVARQVRQPVGRRPDEHHTVRSPLPRLKITALAVRPTRSWGPSDAGPGLPSTKYPAVHGGVMTKETVRFPDDLVDRIKEAVDDSELFESRSEFHRVSSELLLDFLDPEHEPTNFSYRELRAEIEDELDISLEGAPSVRGGQDEEFLTAYVAVRRRVLHGDLEGAREYVADRYDPATPEALMLDEVIGLHRGAGERAGGEDAPADPPGGPAGPSRSADVTPPTRTDGEGGDDREETADAPPGRPQD
jgi:Arc/MetJ-type ribon-helix-helix transcriptional regulator